MGINEENYFHHNCSIELIAITSVVMYHLTVVLRLFEIGFFATVKPSFLINNISFHLEHFLKSANY